MIKKVGIITFHCADNLGAVLQVYGLQQTLKKLNIDSEIIDFRPDILITPYDYKGEEVDWIKSVRELGLLRTIKRFIIKFIQIPNIKKRKLSFSDFRDKYLIISKKSYYTSEELNSNPPKYEYYITGSDQVWNPDFLTSTGASYFLDFAPKESIKISYAASIAKKVEPKLKDVFRKNINRFNHISIRESEHVDFLEPLTDKPITVTLDPTLLLNKLDYINVSISSSIEDKYILVYDILFNDELIKLANKISKEQGYKVISFTNFNNYDNGIKSFHYEGPGEFLGYLEKAEFVLSTSFHGVVFSLIYNKPFYTIPHPTRGSRIINLLTSIGLEDRIIYKADELTKIGYEMECSNVIELLEIRKLESISFLINSLKIDE